MEKSHIFFSQTLPKISKTDEEAIFKFRWENFGIKIRQQFFASVIFSLLVSEGLLSFGNSI